MTEPVTSLAKLDDLLAEFATADTAVPQPQYPSAAERLGEIERLKHQTDEWRRGIEAQLGPLWESAEIVDQIREQEQQKAAIASARSRFKLNGHTPDSLIAKLVGDNEAMNILAQQDAKLAEAERAVRQRDDHEAAMLSICGISDFPSNAPEYSPRQLANMSDREFSDYKARRLAEDAAAHEAWKGGSR